MANTLYIKIGQIIPKLIYNDFWGQNKAFSIFIRGVTSPKYLFKVGIGKQIALFIYLYSIKKNIHGKFKLSQSNCGGGGGRATTEPEPPTLFQLVNWQHYGLS